MSDPIKVLFIVSNLGRGGAEKQLISLLDHADPERVTLKLVSLSRERDEYWENHVRTHHASYEFLPADHGHLARFRFLWRVIAQFKPDVIWGWHFFTSVYALPAMWLQRRGRLVASLRNDAGYLLSVHKWAPHLIRHAHAAVANTAAVFEQFQAMNIKPKRAYVLPNSVPLPEEPIEHAREAHRVGFCGNLHPRKGLDIYIQAAKILVDRGLRPRFVLAGKGDRTPYETQARELGILHYFEFPGEVNCAEFVRELDVFVLPSRHEGCPNVLLEAMALGIPSVATRVGGVGEVVENGKNGLLVPSENPEALADALASILENHEHRFALGRQARASMRRDREAQKIARVDFMRILDDIVHP